MLIYITWDAFNTHTQQEYLSKVHLTDLSPDEIPKTNPLNRYTYTTFKTLCGHNTTTMVEVRRVSSWLSRPCLKCKAIRASTRNTTGSMESYHSQLAKFNRKSSSRSKPTISGHSNILPPESDR